MSDCPVHYSNHPGCSECETEGSGRFYPTPRTDAIICNPIADGGDCVPASFARNLEQELTVANNRAYVAEQALLFLEELSRETDGLGIMIVPCYHQDGERKVWAYQIEAIPEGTNEGETLHDLPEDSLRCAIYHARKFLAGRGAPGENDDDCANDRDPEDRI